VDEFKYYELKEILVWGKIQILKKKLGGEGDTGIKEGTERKIKELYNQLEDIRNLI
jgi:hypothetical protein